MMESFPNVCAVYANDLYYSYTKSEPILKGVNLNIPRATIYGLLGASGCGKTTLLKCILGRLQPSSGNIQIFGAKPGSPESNIPGTGVGYMPQELSLYNEFTIKEILTYFGRIYSLNKNEINERVDQLLSLLQLPSNNKFIGKLSGGQQRRVSLACTLIHSPPLLILDEPTVGTDPVLRQNIWFHLVALCKAGHTIIITTHYIEEARNANNVAFMRNGRILAEDDPDSLLEKHQSTNLEDVFLKLCHLGRQDSNKVNAISIEIEGQNDNYCYDNMIIDDISNESQEKDENHSNWNQNEDNNNKNTLFINKDTLDIRRKSQESDDNSVQCLYMKRKEDINEEHKLRSDLNHNLLVPTRKSRFTCKCSALLHKNLRRITRNWGHLIFEIIFSSLLLMMVIISISDGPTNLKLAVFNEELVKNGTYDWGQLFVKQLDKRMFNLYYYDSIEEAIDSVKSGQNHAAIDIKERFSKAIRLRFLFLSDADEDTIDESQISVHIDRSNQMVGLQVERYLYHAMISFIEEAANRTNISPEALKIPLVFEEPVYGDHKESMREFVLPGCYIVLTFFTTAAVTAHLIHEERRDGLLERSLVAGITATEFLIANLLTQFFILCLQIVFLLILPYILFDRQITGSLTLFIGLTLSQGFVGVTFGLMVAVIVSDTILCALTIIFLFFASIVTGGVLWPIENMPILMQSFSQLMPNTIPIQSMRYVMYRDWTIEYFDVYMGFVVTSVWFAIFITISLVCLRRLL